MFRLEHQRPVHPGGRLRHHVGKICRLRDLYFQEPGRYRGFLLTMDPDRGIPIKMSRAGWAAAKDSARIGRWIALSCRTWLTGPGRNRTAPRLGVPVGRAYWENGLFASFQSRG